MFSAGHRCPRVSLNSRALRTPAWGSCLGEPEHHRSQLRRASLRKALGVPRLGLRTMPRLTRVVVLPVLRRHWALHAKRCPGAAPEKRNALERTYDAFVETAATQWAKLQDAPRHSPKGLARRTIQTILDASRDPDEQFLVELGGGSHPAQIGRASCRERV